MRGNRRDAGYTLVELLVALTLLGFLTVLLFGGLKLGTRVWERSQSVVTNASRIRFLLQDLSDQLQRAYPMRVAESSNASHVAFEGDKMEMRFLTTASTSGALKRVALEAKRVGDEFVLAEAVSGELSVNPPATRTLLAHLTSLSFAYFGRQKSSESARWSDAWHDQNRLPSLVRIRASLRDASLAFPDLIVAPRIDADQGCVLDRLTHTCQGR